MKTIINVQSMEQLVQIANRSGKPVSHHQPLVFPMKVYTDVPDGSKDHYEFDEFQRTFLNADTKTTEGMGADAGPSDAEKID